VKSEIVCSVLEPDVASTERRLRDDAPAGCGLVEIRGDLLSTEELLAVVSRATRPVVVTLRGPDDGGHYQGSDEDRRSALVSALRAGASYIDVESDGALRDLAEGDHAGRVILSHHGSACVAEELQATYASMAPSRAARLKIVPGAGAVSEIGAIRELLQVARRDGRALACFASGRQGAVSRLLAPAWGSWGTYASAGRGAETAEGQFPAVDMLETHDVLGIRDETRRFAIVGSRVLRSPSPSMHNAAYRGAGMDARYFPLELDDLDECLPLIGPGGTLRLEGLAVTMPFKEVARTRCAEVDDVGRLSEAVNTVLVNDGGWSGFNTDGPAILQLVRDRIDPAGARVAVLGAGGTARAAATVLGRAGSEVCLFNRTMSRAREAAGALGIEARRSNEIGEWEWDILVQATPLGADGEEAIPSDRLRGRVVLDAVYGPETPLIRRAREQGLEAIDGFDLLVAQAVLQAEHMTGVRPDVETMRRAGRAWLAR